MLAPLSFLGAAIVMLFPALCFAEMSGRFPFASGAAQYVEEGFGSRIAGLVIGLLMIGAGLVAASTISLGSVRYLSSIIAVPHWIILVVIVSTVGIICTWGIQESILVAGFLTLLEIGGLFAVIVGGFLFDFDLLTHVDRLLPTDWSSSAGISILQATLLAFFAFIGFEGISNIAEETLEPQKTLAQSIMLTLGISTLIYVMVVGVAVLTIGPEDLAKQQAPLSHLFERTTGLPAEVITLIAVVATLNGVIVQVTMISRLAYGLSSRRLLPSILGTIHPSRKTPVYAIAATVVLILVLTLSFHVIFLAEWTSRIILFVFTAVCFAVLRLKLKSVLPPQGTFENSIFVPILGIVSCGTLLIFDLWWG